MRIYMTKKKSKKSLNEQAINFQKQLDNDDKYFAMLNHQSIGQGRFVGHKTPSLDQRDDLDEIEKD